MTDPTSQRIVTVDLDADSGRGEALFKALASEPRLAILRLLGTGRETSASVNAIARALRNAQLDGPCTSTSWSKPDWCAPSWHRSSRGLRKVCYRLCDQIVVCLPPSRHETNESVEIEMPIGAYVDCKVQPTCGLASAAGVIAHYDDPGSFYDPARFNAQLIWFRQGYLEYRFPNACRPARAWKTSRSAWKSARKRRTTPTTGPPTSRCGLTAEIGTWTSRRISAASAEC
jgi:predicted transcriptional regulator